MAVLNRALLNSVGFFGGCVPSPAKGCMLGWLGMNGICRGCTYPFIRRMHAHAATCCEVGRLKSITRIFGKQ